MNDIILDNMALSGEFYRNGEMDLGGAKMKVNLPRLLNEARKQGGPEVISQGQQLSNQGNVIEGGRTGIEDPVNIKIVGEVPVNKAARNPVDFAGWTVIGGRKGFNGIPDRIIKNKPGKDERDVRKIVNKQERTSRMADSGTVFRAR